MKHPEKFSWSKGKRQNEGYSRVARLLEKCKGREWQGQSPETTLCNWVSAYYNAHEDEEPPTGISLMHTNIV